jgi:hypothetical protein
MPNGMNGFLRTLFSNQFASGKSDRRYGFARCVAMTTGGRFAERATLAGELQPPRGAGR